MNTYKICTHCLTAKPRTPEYFYRNKAYLKYGERDGLQIICIECQKELRQENRLNNIDRELKRGRVNNKIWRATNKQHVKQYRKDYYKRNGK